jgi:hypothetical protein
MQDLLPLLISVGAALVMGLIAYGIKKLTDQRDKSDGFARAMLSLAVAASAAVQKVSQAFTDSIKANSADGKLTAEEAKEAGQKALAEMKAMLNFNELSKLLGAGAVQNVEALATAKIEEAVRLSKPVQAAATMKAEAPKVEAPKS